jgi:apolipoprotein N-acyltransferase
MVDDVIAGPAPVVVQPAPVPPAAERAVGAPETAAPKLRPLLPLGWALPASVVSGLLLLMAFPPIDIWYAAPFGVALLGLATYRRVFWAGFGLGVLNGIALLVPLLHWAGGYVGQVWLLLPVFESLYFGVLGGLSALVSPVLTRWRWSWPIVTGLMWIAEEALRDRTPFGGFPWGRLAFSQGDSPLLRLAELGGAPLVTFGTAAIGGLIALGVLNLVPAWRQSSHTLFHLGHAVPVVLAAGLVWAPLLVPAATGGPTAPKVVAVIQGNVPRLGLDFNAQREAVLNYHVATTMQLADDVKAGLRPQPAIVVWPENASDVDPVNNPDAGARITEAARAIGVPILVGGLLDGPGANQVRNVGIVWDPQTGPGQIYAKRHPVPFAEYIPLRHIARMVTDKVDLVRTDFVPGDTPGVMTMGSAKVGDVICFEVAYDDIVRDTVTGGAQMLVVQTNNATFTAAEAAQQLAMVRLRAVELGRPALMASTVGISAFVDTDGTVHDATGFNQQAAIVRELDLRTSRTMATELGETPELALLAGALVVLITAVVIRRRKVVG